MKLLITTFLLPLGLVLLILATGFVLSLRRPGARRLSLCFGAAFLMLYLFSIPAFTHFLALPLLQNIDTPDEAAARQPDAIVVLTGGMYDAGAIGWLPSVDTFQRLAVGFELQRMINLRTPVIVSGGHTEGGSLPSEAAVATQFFSNQRSELTPTELEEASTDTYESAMQLAPMLAERSAHTVILVTSDIHMWRSLATFRARGIYVLPVPALSLPQVSGLRAVLPHPNSLRESTHILYEYEALAAYLLSGKIAWADLFDSHVALTTPKE